MIKGLKPFDPIVVVWEDAYTEGASQHESPAAALTSYKPIIRRSIGFYVGFTDAVIALATDDDRDPRWPQALGGVAYIPAAMVRRVERVCSPVRKK